MEFKEYRAKTVEDATIEAAADLGVESDKLEIEIVERGSSGFLGIGSKPAIINARVKEEGIVETTRAYLDTLFKAMDMEEGTCSIEIGNKIKMRKLLVNKFDVTPSLVELPDGKALYYRVSVGFIGTSPLLSTDVDYMYGGF